MNTEHINLAHVTMIYSHPDLEPYIKLLDREADGNPNLGISASMMRGLILADLESKHATSITTAEFDAAVTRIRNFRE